MPGRQDFRQPGTPGDDQFRPPLFPVEQKRDKIPQGVPAGNHWDQHPTEFSIIFDEGLRNALRIADFGK